MPAGWNSIVSHSHELAVYAFTRGSPIGVDVECIRPMPNAAELLERFFSPEEVQQWRQMPAERQLRAFFQGWTRKEAWLKAVGSGLSFPLNQFCVTLDGPGPRAIDSRRHGRSGPMVAGKLRAVRRLRGGRGNAGESGDGEKMAVWGVKGIATESWQHGSLCRSSR